jgi:hypothetical protein
VTPNSVSSAAMAAEIEGCETLSRPAAALTLPASARGGEIGDLLQRVVHRKFRCKSSSDDILQILWP